jgi:hypothetical protein
MENTEISNCEFWAETYREAIAANRNAYTALYEFFSDNEIREIFARKKKEAMGKGKTSQNKEYKLPDFELLFKLKGIGDALDTYNQQVLVVLATIIEGMLGEFFFCVFCVSPEKMYEYIQPNGEEKNKGKIDIKEVINSPSREDLLISLAELAASKATQGKFKTVIKRLKNITIGEKFSTELTDKIIELNEARNKIVHNLPTPKVTSDDVIKAFENVSDMLVYLEEIATTLGIPVMALFKNDKKAS